MMIRFFMMGLLSGGLMVSCSSSKPGSGSEAGLADNGGYSSGHFYGDSAAPAPAGYPSDGQTFATGGGVPFGHNDPADWREPVPEPVVDVTPVVASAAPPAPALAPAPAPARQGPAVASRRVAASRPPAVADPYEAAYSDGGSYGGDHGAEVAVVTPYVPRPVPVEDDEPAVTTKPKPGAPSAKKSTASGTAKTGKSSTAKVTAKKSGTSGTAVKAVYKPPVKGSGSARKKATVVRVHEVKRGDTLTKLASRYGVTIAELKKRNKLTGDTIVVGKRLTID